MTTLAERLGFDAGSRLLIVNCDHLGMTHADNEGTYAALRSGIATSASVMLPCPWAREAAGRYDGEDVGVHLTLNSEHDRYRWGPLTLAPSLLDGDGGFPRTVEDLWDHADLDEVRRECRAQIERAVRWGIDVTHLDSHLETLLGRPEFFDVYLDLAIELQLPVRLLDEPAQRRIGYPFRDRAAEEGVIFPDYVIVHEAKGTDAFAALLAELEAGVTEVCLHPAIDSPELRAATADWSVRIDDHDLLTSDAARSVLDASGVTTISWRQLRDLAREA